VPPSARALASQSQLLFNPSTNLFVELFNAIWTGEPVTETMRGTRVKAARLRTKLLFAVLVYLLLLGAIGALGLYAAQASLDGMHAATEYHVREVAIVGELASEVSDTQSISLLHALTGSPDDQRRDERDMARRDLRVHALLDELETMQLRFEDEGELPVLDDFRQAWEDFASVRTQEVRARRTEPSAQQALELGGRDGPLDQAYREVRLSLTALQTKLPPEATKRLQVAEQDFSRNRNVLLIVLLFAGCFGVAFGLTQSTRLARAIEALSRAARQVAIGDLTQRVEVATGDELEVLGDSFNLMTGGLQQMTDAQSEQVRALQAEVLERRRVEAALRASEARFRSVTQSVSEAIVSMDRRGRIVFWNSGAQAIFGYAEEEALGRSARLVLPARYHEQFESGLEAARVTGPTELAVRNVELFGLRKDGTEIPIEVSVAECTRGDELSYTATIRDVTERRAVDRMKNEFISMVSHELRTPMSGIIGMAELLLRRELGGQEREYVQAVRRSGEALLGIITDILDISKIEAGKFELDSRIVEVREVVEDAVALLAEQAQRKGLEIACLIEQDVPAYLRGDAARLRQILLNLVGNAIKFTQAGEVVVRAGLVAATADGVRLRFEVTDSGVGIPEEARGRLSQAFSQADSSTTRQYGGTGLGLAIAKRLAEAMGGEVGVASTLGRGSTFWFTVRFAHPSVASMSTAQGDAPPGLRNLRGLVVDDNPTVRGFLQHQLRGLGLVAEAVAGAEEGLRRLGAGIAEAAPVAILLLDRHLPDSDSLALASVIKADPDLASTRVVLLTSVGDGELTEELRGAGIDAVIEKPVRQSRLLEALASVLGLAESADDEPEPLALIRASTSTWSPLVLLVEDSPLNQQVATAMLRELGCRVEMAANGREALATLEPGLNGTHALVLMDCQMPELDGFQTTAEIRRREAGSGRCIPIVAMTASAMQGDRERCLAAGMNDYLAKPMRFEQLAAILGRWIPDSSPDLMENP
jgi:PAS domain S-box-containing protein